MLTQKGSYQAGDFKYLFTPLSQEDRFKSKLKTEYYPGFDMMYFPMQN